MATDTGAMSATTGDADPSESSGEVPHDMPEDDPNGGELDPFGVLEIFPTAPGGREWFSSFDNGNPRLIVDGIDDFDPHDPDDPELYIKQIDDSDIGFLGYVDIDGQGTAEISVDSGRFYVLDPAVLELDSPDDAVDHPELLAWNNVEMTVYFRLDEVSQPEERKHFISLKGPTNHFGPSSGNSNGRNYDVSFRFDDENGEIYMNKENVHGAYSSGSQPPGAERVDYWPEGRFPLQTWVGMKFVVRNRDAGQHVQVEGYRDLSAAEDGIPSEEGGQWEKLFEYVDDGDWGPDPEDQEDIQLIEDVIANDPDNPDLYGPAMTEPNQIWTAPGFACNLRINRVQLGYLRYYSIREIEPIGS